jgi:hypothetical protein
VLAPWPGRSAIRPSPAGIPLTRRTVGTNGVANTATAAYLYAHPGDAFRAALVAAVQPYSCTDTAYNLGYGLPQLLLSALSALGEGGTALGEAETAEGALSKAADVLTAEAGGGAGSAVLPPQSTIDAGLGDAILRNVYRSESNDLASPGSPNISLEQARAAAERYGIDTRLFDFIYDSAPPVVPGRTYYGNIATIGGTFIERGPTGRFLLTLYEAGLRSEVEAVKTIAHELNHVRLILRHGVEAIYTERADYEADFASLAVEIFFK